MPPGPVQAPTPCSALWHDKPPSLSPSPWHANSIVTSNSIRSNLTFLGPRDAVHSARVPPTLVAVLPVRSQVLLAPHTQHPVLPSGRTNCLFFLFSPPHGVPAVTVLNINFQGLLDAAHSARVPRTCVIELPVRHQVLLALQTRHPTHVLHGQVGVGCPGAARVHMLALGFTNIVAACCVQATLGHTPSILMPLHTCMPDPHFRDQVSLPGYGVTCMLRWFPVSYASAGEKIELRPLLASHAL